MNEILIPDEIIYSIAESEADFCRKVKKADPYQSAKNLTTSFKQPWDILQRLAILKRSHELRENKILEIGSGNGFFLCYALKNGLDIVGVEPGKSFGFTSRHQNASRLLEANGIKKISNYLFDASSENLPFSDNAFDIVFSLAVLEHVQDIDQTIRESLRVLKPGGICFASIPNYNSTLEEHYDVFWLPYMSKNIAKAYVKLLGRDAMFINELNFTTPSMFRRYLDSEYSYGSISLYGKPGGMYEKLKSLKNSIDGCLAFDRNKSRPIHKAIIVEVLLNAILVKCLHKLTIICLKLLQFTGSARIMHLLLYKK